MIALAADCWKARWLIVIQWGLMLLTSTKDHNAHAVAVHPGKNYVLCWELGEVVLYCDIVPGSSIPSPAPDSLCLFLVKCQIRQVRLFGISLCNLTELPVCNASPIVL